MPTWRELVHLPEEELRRLDIALVNLACAAGLPGFEKIDVARCLQAIDAMADRARHWTAVHLPAFSKQPHKWDGSEAKFRIHLLVCTLQREFGVRYNPAKIPLEVPFECEDRFIHGIIQGDGGTCASLPVLYTAVGRRLGYPLKLVHAASPRTGYGHQFNRWDSPAERFNIELTRDGWDSPPDDYFRTGMYEISPELERDGCFLKSATPR